MRYSPSGKTMITALYNDEKIYLWDISKSEIVNQFEGHSDYITSIDYSPDGKYIASASSDKTVRLWSVSTGDEIKRFECHSNVISSVAFSPNGKYIASISNKSAFIVWDISKSNIILSINFFDLLKQSTINSTKQSLFHQLLEETTECKFSVTFSPDSKIIASGNIDGNISLWDVSNTKLIKEIRDLIPIFLMGNAEQSIDFTFDSKMIAHVLNDHAIRLWDVSSGDLVKIFISGQRGTWLSCGLRTIKCLRYDDGTLLVQRKQGKILPVLPYEAKHIQKGIGPSVHLPNHIVVEEGSITNFTINIKNNEKNKFFWVNIAQIKEKNTYDPFVFHPPPVKVILSPGESYDITTKISAMMPYTLGNLGK